MATRRKGCKNFTGKLGDSVIYELNGQLVKRSIGEVTADPTRPQLANRQKMALVTALLRPVKDFIRMGFELEAKGKTFSPNNKAVSWNYLNAVKGVYPDQEIDYAKALFSKGRMPVNNQFSIEITAIGLLLTWDPDFLPGGTKPTDHVMLIAYCPEKEQAFYQTDGARRREGREELSLPRYHEKVIVHVYAAFIATDRKSISDSVYAGQLLW
ncbi:MAG TPA: DUF6266 family protein [Pedobacter sp.]